MLGASINKKQILKLTIGMVVFCVLSQFMLCMRRITAKADSAPLATFVVTNTNDSGAGSLRQALQDAGNNAGIDTVTFNIPGTGVQTITLTSGLTIQNAAEIIDGTTQPGWTGTPLIELNGNGSGGDGIFVTGAGSVIRGLIINRFGGNGIALQNVGTDVITGCYIGTDSTGLIDLGNGGSGILISGSPANTIGGLAAVERNVISGNSGNGIAIQNSNSTNNLIQGNYIGTKANGTEPLGNGTNGIQVDAPLTRLGTGAAGARNVISGNVGAGVLIFNSSSASNRVQGNYIGTDVTGTIAVPNDFGIVLGDRVLLLRGSANDIIGTDGDGIDDATEGNVISGNRQTGVVLVAGGTVSNRVAGNRIGTNAAGTGMLPNLGNGISLQDGPASNFIGTNLDGISDSLEGNLIAGNGANGIALTGNGISSNLILGNAVFSNGGLGIDLGGNGLTPNDPLDADTGQNNLQNFPIITLAVSGSTRAIITLNSTPNTAFRVEVFGNDDADPSGNGEGQDFLGFINMTTDASGNASAVFQSPINTPVGGFLTATATDLSGNTSEFSRAMIVLAPTAAFVPVGGRVMTDDGRGLFGAKVVISGTDGTARSAITNPFGYYRFEGIEAGRTYVVQVAHKRYSFAPRTVSVSDEIADLNFVALPEKQPSQTGKTGTDREVFRILKKEVR
jgi:hypothetical protein